MQALREGRRSDRRRLRRLDVVALIEWVQLAKTALAGTLAWFVATDVLGLQQPFLAPWAAVLVVHATVYRTVSRAGQQVAATFLGVFLAWGTGELFGIGVLAMAAMLVLAFSLGRLRWLGEEVTTIATTGIVVLATHASNESHLLVSRLLDTSVGIAVGLVVNLLVWPPLRDRAAWTHVHRLPATFADVLDEIGSGMGPGLEPRDVEAWIGACRRLDEEIDHAWALLRQARESSRLNPRRSRPAGLEDVTRVLHLLEEGVAETLSLARTVAMSAERANLWYDSFRDRWRDVLVETADGLRRSDVDALHSARTELRELADHLSTDTLSQSLWLEYGGVLVNLRNLLVVSTELARWTGEEGPGPRRDPRYPVPRRSPDREVPSPTDD